MLAKSEMDISKKVFITGASGFIGQYVVKRFVQAGWSVRAGVRSKSAMPDADGAEVVEIGDTSAAKDWTALLGSDAVVHLAARAHKSREDDASLFRKINVDATMSIAKGAAGAGIKRFVFISSAGVMGDVTDRPKRETDEPKPVSQYAISKLMAERELTAFCRTSTMELVILRPTLVYGKGNPGNLEQLIKLINKGLPLPFGAARNKRSMCGVGHLADVIYKASDLPNLDGEVFLVADGNDLTTADIVKYLAMGCGRKARLISIPVSFLRVAGSLTGKSKEIEKLFGSFQVDTSKKRSFFGDIPQEETTTGLVAAARMRVS